MAGKRKPRYSGALKEPIARIHLGLLSPTDFQDRHVHEASMNKLFLLLAHYAIDIQDPNRWLKLAFTLACVHVPGMRVINQPGPRKGAPRKWSLERARRFVDRIDAINRERGKGVRHAIAIMKRRDNLPETVDGLNTRYHESKRLLRDARVPLADLVARLGLLEKAPEK